MISAYTAVGLIPIFRGIRRREDIKINLEWSDYAAIARGLRLHAERVEDADRLEGAIADAVERAPALIDVVTTRDAVPSDAGKGLGLVPDRQALTAWFAAEQGRRR